MAFRISITEGSFILSYLEFICISFSGNCFLILFRYPFMLLAAGGIGVTPVMGMLKDVYDVNLPDYMQNQLPHAIQTIYFMWVMPTIADYSSFKDEIQVIVEKSKAPGRPKLVLLIYVTRSKDALDEPFISGRPKIGKLFERMISDHPQKAGLVFACGPSPLVSELWDNCIQNTLKGKRIDFHHEVFEF